jgi:hypothetical protein
MSFLLLLILLVIMFGDWSDRRKERLEVQRDIKEALLQIEKLLKSIKEKR